MPKAAPRRVRASAGRERAGGTKALANPYGESRVFENLVGRPGVFLVAVAVLAGQRLCSNDVVGLDPTGGTDGETGFGARGEVAGGLVVAAKKRGLGGSQVGLCEISLPAIGHRQLRIAEWRLGLPCHRRTQNRDCFVGEGFIIRGDQRL